MFNQTRYLSVMYLAIWLICESQGGKPCPLLAQPLRSPDQRQVRSLTLDTLQPRQFLLNLETCSVPLHSTGSTRLELTCPFCGCCLSSRLGVNVIIRSIMCNPILSNKARCSKVSKWEPCSLQAQPLT